MADAERLESVEAALDRIVGEINDALSVIHALRRDLEATAPR